MSFTATGKLPDPDRAPKAECDSALDKSKAGMRYTIRTEYEVYNTQSHFASGGCGLPEIPIVR
jgi:hypothetical protein